MLALVGMRHRCEPLTVGDRPVPGRVTPEAEVIEADRVITGIKSKPVVKRPATGPRVGDRNADQEPPSYAKSRHTPKRRREYMRSYMSKRRGKKKR